MNSVGRYKKGGGVEAAREPGQRAGKGPHDHLVAARILAEGGERIRSVARRAQGAAERRRDHALAQQHTEHGDRQRGGETRAGRGEQARQLQAVEAFTPLHARSQIVENIEEDEIHTQRRQREIEAPDAPQRQQRDGGGERAIAAKGAEIDAEQDAGLRHIGVDPA